MSLDAPDLLAELRAVRRAATVGVVSIVLFWALVVVAGVLQPEYETNRDYVSALAAVGARRPVVGIAALLVFGIAYLATAVVLDVWIGAVVAAVSMAIAAALTWVVALARIHCPNGAAGCGLRSSSNVLVSTTGQGIGPHLHGVAVALSYVMVALAMLVVAARSARRHEGRRAIVAGVLLVASLVVIPFWYHNESPGGGERVWIAILSAWVLFVCAEPLLASVDPRELVSPDDAPAGDAAADGAEGDDE